MYNTLLTLLVIIAILIIISVMMQPAKTDNALSGGAADLFSKQKPRGFEAFMQKVTVVLGILFFAIALGLLYISSH